MKNRTRSTAAFSIVEVVLALGVAAFCLIAILGLLPAGLNTNQTSTRQTTANGILSAIVADLRATPGTSKKSNLFKIDLTKTKTQTLYFAGDGTYSTSAAPNSIFYAKVKFSRSGGGQQGNIDSDEGNGQNNNQGADTASFADVKVAWPTIAAGDSDEQAGGSGGASFQSAGAGMVETFVGLDRNPSSSGGSGDDSGDSDGG